MVFQPMAIKEISYGGAQVETDFPLQLDSLHDSGSPWATARWSVKGRASLQHYRRRTRAGTLPVGHEFIEPPERVASAIAASSTPSRPVDARYKKKPVPSGRYVPGLS